MANDKKKIFDTLSGIEVGAYVRHSKSEDGKMLPYLPWTHAHQIMMEHFPNYEWSFSENPDGLEVFYFKDGTAEVRVVLSIGEVTMIASKTVVGEGGKPYPNPNASDIHNAKMRCRTRAMAELGLGWDLWINPENYPYKEPESVVKKALEKSEDAKPEQSPEDRLFSKLLEMSDEKKAYAYYKKVEGAWKTRKLDMDDLRLRWSKLKKMKGWK